MVVSLHGPKNRIVNSSQIAAPQNYVIFRPKGPNEPKRLWRARALERGINPPIPDFMVPMRAKFVRLPHDRVPVQEVELQWDSPDHEQEVYQELYMQFSDILLSLGRRQLKQGYGVYGLYSYAGNARKLQSVHLVLPMGVYQDGGQEIPLLAVCCRAPWNDVTDPPLTHWQLRRQRWGIDLAIFVHTLGIYFRNNLVSLDESVAMASRLGFIFPTTTENGSLLFVPVREQLEYIKTLDAPDIENDLGIFGMEMEELNPSTLCGFESRGQGWTIYGAFTSASTAINIVRTYCYWIGLMYNSAPRGILN